MLLNRCVLLALKTEKNLHAYGKNSEMTRYYCRFWQPRRVILTKDTLSFAFRNDDGELDFIPLQDIEFVKEIKDFSEGLRRNSTRSHPTSAGSETFTALQIATRRDGYNSGRSYYLQAETQSQMDGLRSKIQANAMAARKRAEAANLFRRCQGHTRRVYEASAVQGLIALIIVAVSERLRRRSRKDPASSCRKQARLFTRVSCLCSFIVLMGVLIHHARSMLIKHTKGVIRFRHHPPSLEGERARGRGGEGARGTGGIEFRRDTRTPVHTRGFTC